ncbi:uncharacterized protein DS421_16g536720 [Arachis hypogaea]|nr:uncharacterized protein DS421_16g536720 [Arachis hypogaea]
MSEEKKAIVRNLGFGGLMHIPPLRVHHQILKELANSFKLGKNTLEIGYGSFKVRPRTIGVALGINASGDLLPHKVNYKDLSEDNKQIFRRFQVKTLKNLTDEMMAIGVDNEQDRLMFKRIFILYIQMAFLLPTTIKKISPSHVLNFIIKGITDYNLKKKKAIDGCLFALMIVYFHLSKNKDKKGGERPPEPWIANWTREQFVERMRAEMEEHMCILPLSLRLKRTQRIQQGNNPPEKSKKRLLLTFRSEESSPVEKQKTKKKTQRKPQKTQSKKKKVIVENSSPEQAQSYHGSEIGTEELDEFLREKNEKSVAQGKLTRDRQKVTMSHLKGKKIYLIKSCYPDLTVWLSLVEESASDEPAEENMMVVRVETRSQTEALAITPEPPQNLKKARPRFHQLHLKSPEDVAALMMMARTVSYVPKKGLMPSFSLGLTYSSQEEEATQEGAETEDGGRAKTPETPKLLEQLGDLVEKIASGGVTTKGKSPQIRKENGGESFEKFETPARTNEDTADMKEKCYIWAIRVKTYGNGLTNEYDTVCTLKAQDSYILSKIHLASLAAETHIEAEIVSAMCLILNQQEIKRFQEENMAIGNHPEGVFLQPKTNKPFRVEDYLMFIPFLDLKKLASHHYDEVDHFRVEYASRILFYEMNQDKAEAIRGSNAIRLSKPSSLLLSPYCQIDSNDIDAD